MSEFIQVQNLTKVFTTQKGILSRSVYGIRAVDDVSFTMHKGESLAIIGESGSGKTTLARTMAGLITADGGQVLIEDTDILALRGEELRKTRRRMSMVFQNPSASLNPKSTVGEALMRPLVIQGISKKAAGEKAGEMLEVVKLDPSCLTLFPHQLSGGQQQRVSIARALMVDPQIVILDEPTSAVDISVQSDILNLLLDLQERYALTYLLITHNLNVVRYFCDNVLVLYMGRAVEYGSVEQLFGSPTHPYTLNLLGSMPIMNPHDRQGKTARILHDDRGAPDQAGRGCPLSLRCPLADGDCAKQGPPFTDVAGNHKVLCHKPGEARRLEQKRNADVTRGTTELLRALAASADVEMPG